MSAHHSRFMKVALTLAERNLGQTWPNPAVGALVVKDGQIIAEGWTARSGRPHAETLALTAAGEKARGADLYVTLEPCSHHGQTPPCTDAIINAGIARVIIGCGDPNPKVNGQGIVQLQKAGIEVIENICKAEAEKINEGFFSVVKKNRPFVALKIATSSDHKITNPKERWLTGEHARAYGHMLRSQYDAILTGIGTVLADDPLLNCRLPGLEDRSPVRIILDSHLRLPEISQLAKTAKNIPLWVITTSPSPWKGEGGMGVSIFNLQDPHLNPPPYRGRKESIDLPTVLHFLATRGITRLLVEGGKLITTAFLESGLVDRIYWFKAPIVVGDGELSATEGSLREALARFTPVAHTPFPPDTLDVLECLPA